LATRPQYVGDLSQAGSFVKTEKMGLWWGAVPKERWPQSDEWRTQLSQTWDDMWGDRRQELVFIGTDPMDEAALRFMLDDCLVPEQDFSPAKWAKLPDPFPSWQPQAQQ
jgi:G3E family GTPase